MNKYSISLSPLAEYKLQQIIEYLELNWGRNSKKAFIQEFKDIMTHLSTRPDSFPVLHAHPGIRRGLISRKTIFYYRIKENEIQVITVFDHRQDPEKIWKEIQDQFL